MIYAGFVEHSAYVLLGIGYLVGAVGWVVAYRMSRATLVTDFAIVAGDRADDRLMGWTQVVDSFTHQLEHGERYVFLYRTLQGDTARFQVEVPNAQVPAFKQLVARYTARTSDPAYERAYG